jgi:D-methionine transport system substrate-binding protein
MRFIINTVLVSLMGLTIASTTVAADPNKRQIVIGTSVGDFADMVKREVRPMLEKQGYQVKLIEFSDYVRPNFALAEGALDVNTFQHKPYLEDFTKKHKLALTAVTEIPTASLGLYSGKLKSLADVKAGTTVAVPNDPSNEARALVMLDNLGWIKLKANINPLTASERDIEKNIKSIKVVPLEAAQLPRARADVDFSIINGNYATNAGIKLTDALFQEKSNAYINWVVVRTADKDKLYVKDVIAAYNAPQFQAFVQKNFPGYKRPRTWK